MYFQNWYYQHTIALLKELAAELDEIIHQSEKQSIAETANVTEQAADASVDSAVLTADKTITETTANVVVGDTVPSETNVNLAEQPQETEKSEDRVSPHGFGRYPNIPPDYPAQDVWDYPDYISTEAKYCSASKSNSGHKAHEHSVGL